MCGIVGAVAQRNVTNILLEGLRRLEYRGYDSAGIAVIGVNGLQINKEAGKVVNLESQLKDSFAKGNIGIAHTRWATHGKPTAANAHPHTSTPIALVHNGIIENHNSLKEKLDDRYTFLSETDTEVITHLVAEKLSDGNNLFDAVKKSTQECEGAYALAVINSSNPSEMVVTRKGSPLVIGLGIDENFIASDQMALRQVTDRFIYLDEGDIAIIKTDGIEIFDIFGNVVERETVQITTADEVGDRKGFRHFMLKEIYEQPDVIADTLQGRITQNKVLEGCFGVNAEALFDQVEHVKIVACGTSYHTGLVAKHWLEAIANVPCSVEVASEYRYRKVMVRPKSLFVTISQSGETADTLAALKKAKTLGYLGSLVICNVANSSLVRESDLAFMTEAGVEVGVASTKAFTTQLVAFKLLTLVLGRRHGLSEEAEAEIVAQLHQLPDLCREALTLNKAIEIISEEFVDKHHALLLGRGVQYPIALEGALKLKEISYIHAEAYPAGELKHGPLALVDSSMPVVAVAPNDELIDKLKSNLEEVHARGGQLIVFADTVANFDNDDSKIIRLPHVPKALAAIVYTIPLQLLSYHVAVLKGTDVDQPRNLAKSVTVE